MHLVPSNTDTICSELVEKQRLTTVTISAAAHRVGKVAACVERTSGTIPNIVAIVSCTTNVLLCKALLSASQAALTRPPAHSNTSFLLLSSLLVRLLVELTVSSKSEGDVLPPAASQQSDNVIISCLSRNHYYLVAHRLKESVGALQSRSRLSWPPALLSVSRPQARNARSKSNS